MNDIIVNNLEELKELLKTQKNITNLTFGNFFNQKIEKKSFDKWFI